MSDALTDLFKWREVLTNQWHYNHRRHADQVIETPIATVAFNMGVYWWLVSKKSSGVCFNLHDAKQACEKIISTPNCYETIPIFYLADRAKELGAISRHS